MNTVKKRGGFHGVPLLLTMSESCRTTYLNLRCLYRLNLSRWERETLAHFELAIQCHHSHHFDGKHIGGHDADFAPCSTTSLRGGQPDILLNRQREKISLDTTHNLLQELIGSNVMPRVEALLARARLAISAPLWCRKGSSLPTPKYFVKQPPQSLYPVIGFQNGQFCHPSELYFNARFLSQPMTQGIK